MNKKLGFGLMRLPLLNKDDDSSINMDIFKQMVDTFISSGFTYFDTAWMYCGGKSEEAVKEAIVMRYPRNTFTITTKMPAYMLKCKDDREWLFNEQLRRTGLKFFDYYWLHDVNSQTLKTFDELDCWNFILKKKEAGLIKHIGFSYHDGPELLDSLLIKHPEIEYVQIQLNYLDWDSPAIQSHKCYDVITKHNKPVIVMEPVKGGTLATRVPEDAATLLKSLDSRMSIPSWAIRFAASRENVFMVLSGMSNMEQLLDNTSYMSEFIPLTDNEEKTVLQVANIIGQKISIPCTGCSYCTVNCPKNISIPEYFSLYNTEMIEDSSKSWTTQGWYYERLGLTHGKASDCIKCGQCERMCPQHLQIREYLELVAKTFE